METQATRMGKLWWVETRNGYAVPVVAPDADTATWEAAALTTAELGRLLDRLRDLGLGPWTPKPNPQGEVDDV